MAKENKMIRVEKHLYKAQYLMSDGNWSTRYDGLFRDWKKKSRCFPLGDALQGARDKLGVLHKRNDAEYDFDEEKVKRAKAAEPVMTLEKWVPQFLNLIRTNKSAERDAQHCAHLVRHLGKTPLEAIGKNTVLEYKNTRLTECIMRYAKPVEGKLITISTVNREIRALIHALRMAEDAKLINRAPSIKLDSEAHRKRERVLTKEEYRSLLEASPRWLQRVVIGANETALDQGDQLRLTWDQIQNGLIKLLRTKTIRSGAKQVVAVSPELATVLDELRNEQEKLANIDNRVFTRAGKPLSANALRSAFEQARAAAGIENFIWKDFRHCARTRWGAAGLPTDIAEKALGHKLPGLAETYSNLQDADILARFNEMFQKILNPFKIDSDAAINDYSK